MNSTVLADFWASAVPYKREKLVGQTNTKSGINNADEWSFRLGLSPENTTAMLLRMTGKLIAPEAGEAKLTFRCRSACHLFIDGQRLTDTPIGDDSVVIRTYLSAGSHDWHLELISRPDDSTTPLWRLKANLPGVGVTAHSELFGPGVRAFRSVLKVVRGIDGSVAVPHSAEAAVTSPLYEGSSGDACAVGHPGGHGGKLVYWAEKTPEAMEYWGRLLGNTMLGGSLHGYYYDASGINVPSFNMGDARGRGAAPWNFATGAQLTSEENFYAYGVQYAVMQTKAHELSGEYPVMMSNGNGPGAAVKHGSFFKPGGPIPAGIYGHTESGFKTYNGNWLSGMKNIAYTFQNNLGISLQCKSSSRQIFFKRPSDRLTFAEASYSVKVAEYCYGNYLMSKVAGNHTPQIEWDLTFFEGMREWHRVGKLQPENTTFRVTVDVPAPLYYPLGDPVETVHSDAWPGTYRVAPNTYARRFQNGIVLVNPVDPAGVEVADINNGGDAAVTVTGSGVHDARFDDTIALSGKMIDAGSGEVIDSLTVKGGEARFLLSSSSLALGNDAISNVDKQYVAYYRSQGLDDHGNPL